MNIYLILASTPEVRRWPFYGKVLEVIEQDCSRRPIPDWVPEKERLQYREQPIQEFRTLIKKKLEDARRVVEMLETDLQALDETFPVTPSI